MFNRKYLKAYLSTLLAITEFISFVLSTEQQQQNNVTTITTELPEPISTPPMPNLNNVIQIVTLTMPNNCSQREKLKKQPKPTLQSKLRKCCPLGENLDIYRENQSDAMCDSGTQTFVPPIISAVLYDNCIEDTETSIELPFEVHNPCNTSFLYNSGDEDLFVLQDASLLILDKNRNETFAVVEDYCMDIDKSGKTFAIVCITQVDEHLARAQMLTVAVLMLISIPCLFIVSYLHIYLKVLRSMNGIIVSLMSFCLATGYFVYSVVHIYNIPSGGVIGYIIQFFILSYFCWYFCLCCNVLLNIWIKLPMNIQITRTMTYIVFNIYCLLSIGLPAVLVSLTVQKGLPGMPSYFIQGLTESIRGSQRYFIPPVSTLLCLSFVAMIAAFFGFQRIKNNGYLPAEKEEPFNVSSNAVPTQPKLFDQLQYEEVKKDAKCLSLMCIVMNVLWLLEIVTFYTPGDRGYLLFCDMINGLQGVFILLIFLVVRRRRTVILRWWYDRGSHSIESAQGTELREITK